MLDEETLSLPAREGARAVALELLHNADAAATRLALRSTPRSLHDFRVALRQLRSWLRAFRTELGTAVRQKDRDRLRAIARATSSVRDADVQLGWAREVARRWSGERRKAAKRFAQYLMEHGAPNGFDAALLDQFEEVRAELQRRIGTQGDAGTRTRSRRTLADAMAREVGPHLKEVTAALDKVRTVDDEKVAHEARIAAKRLRYLVEPATPFVKRGRGTLRQLKALQTELGVLHDAHMIEHAVQRAAMNGTLGKDVPRRAQSDLDAAFARVRKHWLKRRPRGFSRDVKSFSKRLSRQ